MICEKETVNILIVDDDKDQILTLEDASLFLNKQLSDVSISLHCFNNVADGLNALKTRDFDGAIIDLKFVGDNPGNGSEIIREIRSSLRFPVVIYSGHTGDLDIDLQEEKDTCFFRVYNRTSKNSKEILEELLKLYQSGLTKIMGRRGILNTYLNNIFWIHIPKSIDEWIKHDQHNKSMEKILLRYTVSHLYEYLEIDNEGNFEDFHPYEMYIMPPIKKEPFTGCIVKRDEEYFIVLSPACDFAQGKCKNAVIAIIEQIGMNYVKEAVGMINKGDSESKRKGEERIQRLLSNSDSYKYHFLPPCQDFRGGFVNFQKLHSVSYKELKESFDIIASLSISFTKDVIARFSHYYSRQGQPNILTKEIYNKILEL